MSMKLRRQRFQQRDMNNNYYNPSNYLNYENDNIEKGNMSPDNQFKQEYSDNMYKHNQNARNYNRPSIRQSNIREKKKKQNNDSDFQEVVKSLFDLLNDCNKHSKQNYKKNKRNIKNTSKFDFRGINNYEFMTKKHKNSILDICNEDYKKDSRKEDLYRFKDEIQNGGDLHNLNLYIKKQDPDPFYLEINKNPFFKNIQQNMPNMQKEQTGTNNYLGGLVNNQNMPNINAVVSDILKKSQMPNSSNNLEASSTWNQYLMLSSFLGENFPNKLNQLENMLGQAGLNYSNNPFNINAEMMMMMIKNHNPNLLGGQNLMNMGAQIPAYQQKQFMQNPKGYENQLNKHGFMNQNPSQQITQKNDEKDKRLSGFNDSYILVNQNSEKTLNTGNTPFKRAATHVAISYFIYIKSLQQEDISKIEKNKIDPTYNARLLRERKNDQQSDAKNFSLQYDSSKQMKQNEIIIDDNQVPDQNLVFLESELNQQDFLEKKENHDQNSDICLIEYNEPLNGQEKTTQIVEIVDDILAKTEQKIEHIQLQQIAIQNNQELEIDNNSQQYRIELSQIKDNQQQFDNQIL